MIVIQVVPKDGINAYKILKDKTIHESKIWYFSNKANTKLRNHSIPDTFIEINGANGILVAKVHAQIDANIYKVVEKFIGNFIQRFGDKIAAINIQVIDEKERNKNKK